MSVATRPAPRAGAREAVSRWANTHRQWIFAGPAIAFVAVLIGFPLVWTTYLSLTDAQGSVRSDFSFIGLQNYSDTFADTVRFWPAMWRTAAFTIGALVVELVMGMVIALLLWRPFRGERIVRVSILLPFVATPVAVAMMWRLIFDPNIGIANSLLERVGIPAQQWLAGPSTALPTLALIDAWEFTPMVALILLAGLTALPVEPDEAARIDGANAWQRFRYVTLPLLRPVVVVAAILRGIDALKTFDIFYTTKGEGGGSFHEAETLNVYIYGLSFKYNDFGVASAVLLIFFALIVVLMVFAARLRKVGR